MSHGLANGFDFDVGIQPGEIQRTVPVRVVSPTWAFLFLVASGVRAEL
jgi:hypothetical protein